MKVTYKEYNKSMQMVPVHTIKQRICMSSEPGTFSESQNRDRTNQAKQPSATTGLIA